MSAPHPDTGVDIPAPWPEPFVDGIRHPELWLWDSWIRTGTDGLHLYCLALAKRDRGGTSIAPAERNRHRFHVREFVSGDDGRSFADRGVFFVPATQGSADARNVWSGHVFGARGRRFAYTGVSQPSPQRAFVQAICLAERSDTGWTAHVLSQPEADYDAIRAAGYYLGPRETLGDVAGEDGGPILAWRDPFALEGRDGVRLFWSAKIGPKTPAIASADLIKDGGAFALGPLRPPIRLPDADIMTQAEVPKLYRVDDGYLMLIAACDRLFEGQPDAQVSKRTRAYRAPHSDGPWTAVSDTSALAGLDHLFGVSAISASRDQIRVIGPYTEMAPPDLQLGFSVPRVIDL